MESLERKEPPAFTEIAVRTVRTDEEYVALAEDLKTVKAFRTRVEEFFAPLKKAARESWQKLVDAEKDHLAPAEKTEAAIKRELVRYSTEKEEQQRQEEARLAEEARKREEARRLEEAAALEREGVRTGNDDLVFQAEDLLQQPVETPHVSLGRATPKVAGLSFKETWSARVVDFLKLVKWVAKNPRYVNLLAPHQTNLNALARAQREQFKVDGVVAEKGKGAASR